MKTLFNPWFIGGCAAWLIVITFRKLGHPVPVPLINNYLDDIIAIPVIANIALWFQRVFVIKNSYYVLPLRKVIFIVVYVSVVFEGLLPAISKRYTGDWMDVLVYVFGGLFFYLLMNKPVIIVRPGTKDEITFHPKVLSPKS